MPAENLNHLQNIEKQSDVKIAKRAVLPAYRGESENI